MSADSKNTYAYLTESGWTVEPSKGDTVYEKLAVYVSQSFNPGNWHIRHSTLECRSEDTEVLDKLHNKYGDASNANLDWD